MKALKRKLGIEKAEERLGLDKVYAMRDKMSDKQLSDALKRASTEEAIKKILSSRAEEKSSKKTKESETKTTTEQKSKDSSSTKDKPLSGTVEGEGTSRSSFNDSTRKTSPKPDDYYDPIDSVFVNNTTVSNARNSQQSQIGQNYIYDLLLLEDKSR